MARVELLERHGLDAPGAERPRGRGAKQPGPDDRDIDLLHAATIAGAARRGRTDRRQGLLGYERDLPGGVTADDGAVGVGGLGEREGLGHEDPQRPAGR